MKLARKQTVRINAQGTRKERLFELMQQVIELGNAPLQEQVPVRSSQGGFHMKVRDIRPAKA